MNPTLGDFRIGPLQLIGWTAQVGVLAYVSSVLVLRRSGKGALFKPIALRGDEHSRIASCG